MFDVGLSGVLRRNFAILVLAFAAGILYLAFLSRSFDEWDAFNFALALSRYDVAAHQPHPPGYPVFIFISSIPYTVTNDPLFSLTLVSAVSGALTLIPTYVIAKRLFNREVALFSALALMVASGFWLVSEQAVSDMLFTLLLMVGLSQLLSSKGSKVQLFASWGTLGLALGVRPVDFVLIAPFAFETARIARRRDLLYCVIVLLVVLCGALVPAVLLTGYNQYLNAVFDQFSRHLRDDVRPFGMSGVERLVFLFLALGNDFGADLPFRVMRWPLHSFVSTSLFALVNVVLVLFLCAVGLLLLRRVRDLSKVMLVLMWVIPYFAFVYLLGSPGYARYMLPILPPILILLVASVMYAPRFLPISASGLSHVVLGKVRIVFGCVIVALLVTSMFAYSLPLATVLHTEPAPNVQLVTFVRSNYNPSNTTIVVFHELRAFQFYGQEFRYVHCCYEVRKTLGVIKSDIQPGHTVLITDSALKALQQMGISLNVSKVAEFYRNSLAKFEDFRVILYRVDSLG
jgi:4-amino-4-deoxy-L-arabinose transferase-like glycosyltransferase